MKFDKILSNNKLWAVRYENETDNVLRQLFSQWSDPEWLMDFFCNNMSDLEMSIKQSMTPLTIATNCNALFWTSHPTRILTSCSAPWKIVELKKCF